MVQMYTRSSTTQDSAEPSGSGCTAGGSSDDEDSGYGGSCDATVTDGPTSPKRPKVTTQTSACRPKSRSSTGKFKPSWKLPQHVTASKRSSIYAHCKLCVSDLLQPFTKFMVKLSKRLLKMVLSFFISPRVFRVHGDDLWYMDTSNHLYWR